MADGTALTWNDEIENDGEGFTLLPDKSEGTFTVTTWERGHSHNLGCPMAKLTLRVENEHGATTVYDNIVLHTTCEWKLCQFFTAIGARKHGDRITMDWTKVSGARGRCRVKVDTFEGRDGKQRDSNKIDAFLDPTDTPAARKPASTPPQHTVTRVAALAAEDDDVPF